MRFTFRTGERPLPGYTIKRGVGQGGFGEVYFAISDAGKEVALKLLRNGSDVEIRGVANCLNLKHPNLVHVYDLRTDDRGGQWLVMEYVLGESLAQVLDRHPNGLPADVAVEWFRGLAKAVNYLHDHGVVHRDLKPANIFIEHGNLKVGDYGLCKAMSNSHRKQTRAVGTVEYMAPEVSNGLYTKSIDIYACGVILYEMLAGVSPFRGETDAEILMKHLTADADLSKVPAAFREVVGKSLEKDPARRYETLNEMLRAVELSLSPASGVSVPLPVLPKPARTIARPVAKISDPALPVAKAVPRPGVLSRDRLSDLSGTMVKAPLVVALGVIPWAAIAGNLTEWAPLGKGFLLALAIAWAALLTVGGSRAKPNDRWSKRLRMAAFGLLIGFMAFWLDGWPMPADPTGDAENTELYLFDSVRMAPGSLSMLGHYLLYYGATVGLIGWWKMAARDRKDRFSLFPLITTGLWGFGLLFLWPLHDQINTIQFGVVPLVLAAVAVQWVSPWAPPPPPMPRRLRWRG